MRNWATVNGKGVRQRLNRQQTRMAAAGTLPMSMYEIEKTGNINQVKVYVCIYLNLKPQKFENVYILKEY